MAIVSYQETYKALDWYFKNRLENDSEKSAIENLTIFSNFIKKTIHGELSEIKTEENEQAIRNMCKYVIAYLLPYVRKKIRVLNFERENGTISQEQMTYLSRYLDLEDDLMAIASFRSLIHFATYMETQDDENQKVWKYTMDTTMGSIFYYANAAILNKKYKSIVKQTPAGFGKCCHANQDILTSTGYKKAKDLKIGDLVYSMKENKPVLRKIVNKWDTIKKQVKITARNGVELIVSPEHRMWTQRGYVQAKDLTTDDYLYYLFGPLEVHGNLDELIKTAKFRWIKIISIKNDDIEVPMIDFEVEDTHNFILDGFVSHNSKSDCVIICFIFGYDINADVVKMVGNPSVLDGITENIVKMLKSEKFGKVFPLFGKYKGSDDMFSMLKVRDGTFGLTESKKSISFACYNKDTKISGTRFNYQFYDDITQQEDAENIDKHKKDLITYRGTWAKREYNQFDTIRFFTGTSYHREDFLSQIIKMASDGLPLICDLDTRGKYAWSRFVKLTNDKKCVVIKIPKLADLELGEDKCWCTFPQKFSKYEALKLLHSPIEGSRREFFAMEQQTPLPPEALKFDIVYLRQYDELPQDILDNNCRTIAIIDPVRKGIDNFACLIFKSVDEVNWYWVDCYYKKKQTSKYAIPKICERLAFHKVDEICFEQNTTDPDLMKDLIDQEMLKNNYTEYHIEDFWSNEKKEDKILNCSDEIIAHIIFPRYGMYAPESDMGRAYDDVVNYNIEGKNKRNDDSIDCCAMLIRKLERKEENSCEVLDLGGGLW